MIDKKTQKIKLKKEFEAMTDEQLRAAKLTHEKNWTPIMDLSAREVYDLMSQVSAKRYKAKYPAFVKYCNTKAGYANW
jgi:hypothetical protein